MNKVDQIVKKYRIIAVANTIWLGISEEDAKLSFMMQAETLGVENWSFIHIEEIKE